jgi:hypothetical protein
VTTHHMSHLKEYKIYKGMKGRCYNPHLKEYPDYGGRGIVICDLWLGRYGFENFIAEVGLRPHPKMSIERRDVNRGYEPGNCYWATTKEQHKNRRRFVAINNHSDEDIIAEYNRRFNNIEYGMSGC